ncbi:MAG: hypothetical protein ACOCZ5_02745 [bacterium]
MGKPYDQMKCGECGFSPTTQENEDGLFKSKHWTVTYENEYFPSEDRFKSWEEVSCPICGKIVYSTL